MTIAFVVTGQAGEYSDWRLWLIGGFTKREDAESVRQFLEDVTEEVKQRFPCPFSDPDEHDHIRDFLLPKLKERGLDQKAVNVDPEDEWRYSYAYKNHFEVEELPWDTSIAGGIPRPEEA